MDDATTLFLYIIGILAFLAATAVYFYKLWISRRHTRERFAYYSVRVFVAFMISAIFLLLVRNQGNRPQNYGLERLPIARSDKGTISSISDKHCRVNPVE